MNAKNQSNSMEKKLCRQLFLSLSLYAALGLADLGIGLYFSSFSKSNFCVADSED